MKKRSLATSSLLTAALYAVVLLPGLAASGAQDISYSTLQEYEKATIKLTAVCEASGIKTLTDLLLGKSEQVRCAAAKALLAHADKFKAQKVHVTGEMKHTITTTELIRTAARSGFRRTNLIHELMNGAEN